MKNSLFRDGIDTVAVCVPDTIGRLIGKRITVGRYQKIEKVGLPMPDYHLINGVENIPYKDLEITGEATGFRNGLIMPIPESCFYLSGEPNTAFLLAEPHNIDGALVEHAPRQILKRQLEQLTERGIAAKVASELEFFLFKNTYEEAYDEGYRELRPFYHYHADWDVLLGGHAEPIIRAIRHGLTNANIEIEGYQGEGGSGQYEINIPPDNAIEMADKHCVFKHVVKSVAHDNQCSASFMAKVDSNAPGSSCHVHLSFTDLDGNGLDENGHIQDAFIAGLLNYSPELTLLHAPFENSYRRLQPGTFAPCNVSWGWDNRTVMLRLIKQGSMTRMEFRLPGADVNPYLCFAGILAAGIEGIEQRLQLPPPTDGSAYKESGIENTPSLPSDLTESVDAFKRSELAKKAFSISVHKHLLDLGASELNAGRRIVTDWQIERGFERA